MATTTQQISLDGQTILNTITSILPVLSGLVPVISQNQQLISLSTSAAQNLLTLIGQLPTTGSGSITVAQQAALLAETYKILSGGISSSPEWTIQT